MGLTYYGHPMSCAVGIATLEVYEEDGLIENSRKMGEVLADELRGILSRLAAVGDVRSIGLFSVLELVADHASRAPLDAARRPVDFRQQEHGVRLSAVVHQAG